MAKRIEKSQSPVTRNELQGELKKFFKETIEPGFDKRLIRFYNSILEPQFQKIQTRLDQHDERFDEISGNFDAVFKVLEDLQQEYDVANEQFKRLEKNAGPGIQLELISLKNKLALLQAKVVQLEKKIH
jgi:predicted nuclease with TOPRIM domain